MLKVPSLSLSALCLRLVVVAFCVGLFACDDSEETGETISLNCAGEVDSGSTTISISGYVKDGKTGTKKSGTVNLYNSTGTTLLDNSSVGTTKYSFSGLSPSTYVIKASITDYVSVTDTKCLTATDSNKDLIVLTSSQATKANVIVLSWSSGPNDLDSHLISSGGSPSPSHIGYVSGSTYDGKWSSSTDETTQWAWLDKDALYNSSETSGGSSNVDCTSSSSNSACPPETITIKLDSTSGPIRNSVTKACYYIYNYSGSTSFSQTNAQVQLFQSDGTLLTNLDAPADTNTLNRYWHVFDLDSNLNITIKNSFDRVAPTCS